MTVRFGRPRATSRKLRAVLQRRLDRLLTTRVRQHPRHHRWPRYQPRHQFQSARPPSSHLSPLLRQMARQSAARRDFQSRVAAWRMWNCSPNPTMRRCTHVAQSLATRVELLSNSTRMPCWTERSRCVLLHSMQRPDRPVARLLRRPQEHGSSRMLQALTQHSSARRRTMRCSVLIPMCSPRGST